MEDELKPKPSSYDIELEKMRLELEKRRVESGETLHKGWQEVANNIAGGIERSWRYGKEVESRFSRSVLYFILVLFVAVGLLTYLGTIPGQVFTFFTGTLVGYLLSITPLVRGKGKAS